MSQTRRLAAILAADVAGYSRLIGADEEGTLNRLRSIRTEVVDPSIAQYRGASSKLPGTACWSSSPVSSMPCGVRLRFSRRSPSETRVDSRIELRVRINLGDVIVDGDDVYGDGVNIAARI